MTDLSSVWVIAQVYERLVEIGPGGLLVERLSAQQYHASMKDEREWTAARS